MGYLESVSAGRRRFLLYVGGLAAAFGAGPLLAGEALTKQSRALNRTIYFLDPEWGAGTPACVAPDAGAGSCRACAACHSHAANKLFTSAALADRRRAHPHCKCLVKSRAVSNVEFVTIFGPPSGPLHRDEFDRRRDRLFLPPHVLDGG
jgi:hypothetical protein